MNVIYRLMRSGEEDAVCQLITECFNQFVAPDYAGEGVREFLKYVTPESLQDRSYQDHFVIVASDADRLIGIIEVRSHSHICLLFVKAEYHNMGVAKKLLGLSLDYCRRASPSPDYIEVNSSPYAVKIYEKLGFTLTGAEQEINGIRFTPMKLSIK